MTDACSHLEEVADVMPLDDIAFLVDDAPSFEHP